MTKFNLKTAKPTGRGLGSGGPRQGTQGTDYCYCPKCGKRIKHERGQPCVEKKCPKCDVPLTGRKPKKSSKEASMDKEAQIKIHEKMLADNRDEHDTKANDNTGNLDWLLKELRKDQKGDRIQEKRLTDTHSDKSDNRILEGELNEAAGGTEKTEIVGDGTNPPKNYDKPNRTRISDDQARPLMDYAVPYDVEREKKFKSADDEDKKDRNTALWDKFIGVQLDGPKTVITNNVQRSQLLSNYETRKDMLEENPSRKTAEALTGLMDADAILYHIYKKARVEDRELNEVEKSQIVDINSGKARLLTALRMRGEDAYTPTEWDEEGRAETSQLLSDAIEMQEKERRTIDKEEFQVGDNVVITNRDFRGEKAVVRGSKTNAFGAPLVEVSLIDRQTGEESERTTVFYPGELKKVK